MIENISNINDFYISESKGFGLSTVGGEQHQILAKAH
jgi:hypothetical protein